jgi:hypothetical protein
MLSVKKSKNCDNVEYRLIDYFLFQIVIPLFSAGRWIFVKYYSPIKNFVRENFWMSYQIRL